MPNLDIIIDEPVAVCADNTPDGEVKQPVPLLLDAKGATDLLSIAPWALWRFASAGYAPVPVRLALDRWKPFTDRSGPQTRR